jgi:DNA-binding transcriptional MerR regulator
MKETISIGQASKLLNISIDTIRYYEKIGLIPPIKRLERGYRILGVTDLLHLKGIIYLRDCNLSLDTIRGLSEDASKKDALVQEGVDHLEDQIKALEKSKAFLKEAQLEIREFEKETSKYVCESLEGYFCPINDREISLETYLESDHMAWLIPIDQNNLEITIGQINKNKVKEGINLKGLKFIRINFEFDNQKDIEKEIYKLISYGQANGWIIGKNILMMVYSKTSCFSGKSLAGKLLLEIQEE